MISNKVSIFIKSILLLLFIGAIAGELALAQSPFPNARDDSYPLLGLKRAKSSYDRALNELKRSEELYEKDLISLQDLESVQNSFFDAEVNYQQSLLVLLFEQQFVTISDAVKYQDDNNRKRVKVTLSNASSSTAEYNQLIDEGDKIFESLKPDEINNIYVSLSNDDGAIISNPYEIKLASLNSGDPKTLDFELLQDLDEVTVNIIYGNGSSRSPKVFLKKDASANRVLLQSEQFSQELELGNETLFDLSLELFSGLDNTYKLEVVNLPNSITRNFTEPGGNARVSQIRFSESTNTRSANLNISLPDRPTDDVQMDEPISFYVLAIPRDRLTEFNDRRNEIWTQDEIHDFNVGYVKLEMIPRGVGRLLVKAPQLYNKGTAGDTLSYTFQVVNDGTRRLDNVEFELDIPIEWEKEIRPAILPELDIREEETVTVKVLPPKDITVGRYEARLRSTALSDNQPVNAEDKSLTAEIVAEASIVGTSVILLLLLGLISTVVIFAIKLSKK